MSNRAHFWLRTAGLALIIGAQFWPQASEALRRTSQRQATNTPTSTHIASLAHAP